MKAAVRWIDDVMFLAESGSGHTVTIDGPDSEGGRNVGVRPMGNDPYGSRWMCEF